MFIELEACERARMADDEVGHQCVELSVCGTERGCDCVLRACPHVRQRCVPDTPFRLY